MIAIFPWVFSYQGILFGHPVSIRALGNVIGVALLLLGVGSICSLRIREGIAGFARNLEKLPGTHQNRFIAAVTLIFALGAISHKLRAHYLLATHAYDLGFFSNICWNTANGNWFYSSELERNFMGVHVNWILWPLSVIYKAFPGASVLLVSQALIMSAALPLVWKFTQRATGYFMAGAVAAMLLACSPYFEHTLSNDFHPDVWLLPCLFAALMAWHADARSWLLFFGAMALLAKEDVSVVLCGFGLMLMLWRGWRWTGVALVALALGAFYFHVKVFTPKFLDGGESLLFTRYPILGDDYGDFARNLIYEPGRFVAALLHDPSKYWRMFCYLLPMAGLTLLSPAFLIPPIISLAPHLLSQAGTQLSLADIYALPSQPFLFSGAALGAAKLIDRFGVQRCARWSGILFLVAGAGVFNSPRYYRSQSPARVAAFQEAAALIPSGAPLAAQQCLQPHFETRRYIQLFPIRVSMPEIQKRVLENPDFIICDRIGNAEPGTGDMLREALARLEWNKRYQRIYDKENFMVFQRIEAAPMAWRDVQQ